MFRRDVATVCRCFILKVSTGNAPFPRAAALVRAAAGAVRSLILGSFPLRIKDVFLKCLHSLHSNVKTL